MHIVVDPRLVRRVIKAELKIYGIGRPVPHRSSWVVDRSRLLELASAKELGVREADLQEQVVMISRPDATGAEGDAEILREAYHAHVHLLLERRVAEKKLGPAVVRERTHRIGQTEFDEIRAVLRGEERLGDGADDTATYVEFAATWLELAHFDEAALGVLFPTLRDRARVTQTLALDVDLNEIAERSGASTAPRKAGPSRRPPASSSSLMPPRLDGPPPDAAALLDTAAEQRAKGNHARAAISMAKACADPDADVTRLTERLLAALRGPDDAKHDPVLSVEGVRAVLLTLVEVAARSTSSRPVEARILHDLTKACVDSERGRKTVDVVTWVTSLFSRPIVRQLPAVRVVRVVRHLRRAFTESHRARLDEHARERLEEVFHAAIATAERNARDEIAPAIQGSLHEVGLVPASVPEAVAEDKLIAELLDRILDRGFIGLSDLRDAISRNNLKLPRLRGVGELVMGDPILAGDRLLARRLDGVYRSGEIYLRLLQKASSVAFGTSVGRFVTAHAALPMLAAFTLLEGLQHVVGPLTHKLAHVHVHLLNLYSFVGTAFYLYLLIHVVSVREFSLTAVKTAGHVLHAVVIAMPRAILTSALVTGIVRSRPFSLVGKPLVFGAPVYLLARRHFEQREALGIAAGVFLLFALLLGTSFGARLEEAISDGGGRLVRLLTKRLLPATFAFIADLFKTMVERVDRALYAVDEWLTFKEGESKASLWMKGTLGFLWFFATYLVRVYVNLLIEPQVNPIKHFPVVTVSHKIILPFTPTLLAIYRAPLMPLGAVFANTVGGITTFLTPGIFGFLVWELKENWKLYAHNRAKNLSPVSIGHHGETMRGLLVPGFHSGTVPKIFIRLRRALRRGSSVANTHREAIHEVEHAVAVFVERELCGLLNRVPAWNAGPVEVFKVVASSNRLSVELGFPGLPDRPLAVHFEEQSGWLVAGMGRHELLDDLTDGQRALFHDALAGLYKLAGADIVREQVASLLGASPYDVADDGLVVWPDGEWEHQVVFDLEVKGTIEGAPAGKLPPLDGGRALFSRQPIAYDAWEEVWKAGKRLVIAGPGVTGR